MVGCSAYGCKSRSERKVEGITFHRFPMKDPERLALWIQRMHMRDFAPTQNDKLCSNHFEKKCFYKIGEKTCLLDNTVPTIFEELPKYLQERPQQKRATKRSRSPVEPVAGPARIGQQQAIDESRRVKKLRRALSVAAAQKRAKSRKLKVLGQKLKRYKKKIVSLKQIVTDLTKKNLISLEQSNLLSNLPEITKELVKRKQKRNKYSPALRKFAVTLSFFSPRAYDYVRNVFNSCLPHRSTIGKWFQTVNAEPGFTQESFDILKSYVQLSKYPTYIALSVDEISTRRHVEWDGKRFHGYVNYGVDLQDDGNAMAKEAFVLMATCINGQWKLPVGYFFTDGLNGNQKATLVTQCIRMILESGAFVVSLTFDGAPSNITMGNILGCQTDFENLKTFFSIQETNIHVFYDYCHMLKLVRNTFGEKQNLIDGEGNIIKWEFLEKLDALQDSEGLHLGNKLRKAHLKFFKQKMKVKLAVQLLSNSVADALSYCEEELGLREFKGCQATCKFIKTFNNIFDILNSRSLIPPGFKKALCASNIVQTTNFINTAIEYISQLRFTDGELVIKSRRKTGFLGLIISLKSAILLFNELVTQKQSLVYLPLYKTCQDHLELFFSSIRAKGGWNNNPTSRQFTAAYKRLLVRAEIRDGGMGNSIPLEEIPILTGSSRFENPDLNINLGVTKLDRDMGEETMQAYKLETIWSEHEYIMNTNVISNCSLQIVVYIAGFVTHQLFKSIKCEECLGALSGDKENFLNSLISKKNRGGLTYPSKDIIEICKICEHFLRTNETKLTKNNFVNILKSKVMHVCIENNYFSSLQNHVMNCNNNHIYFLTESVISKYFNIRLHFITKKLSEIADPVRNQFTKLILFKGQ